jgi:hypothetical protein
MWESKNKGVMAGKRAACLLLSDGGQVKGKLKRGASVVGTVTVRLLGAWSALSAEARSATEEEEGED